MSTAAASHLFEGRYEEARIRHIARELRERLDGNPTFGLVFATPDYIPHLEDFLEIIRLHGRVATLVGCSSPGLIGTGEENEGKSGFSLLLVHLPGVTVTAVPLSAQKIEDSGGPKFWHHETGLTPAQVRAWLCFTDPFQFPVEPWLQEWNAAYPGIPTFGGLAASDTEESWVYHNDHLVEGSVALALQGGVQMHAVVSQGCKPIGEPFTVTRAEQNVLYTLGSRPAYEVLNGAYQQLTDQEKEFARGHLFAGLAMNEYVDDFKRGDFLVRHILGADPNTGAVAIAAHLRVGQTLQYQLRDPQAASDDLHSQLARKQKELAQSPPIAGLLCSCNGRGAQHFKRPHHDASMVNEFFPQLPVAGFFANGEMGPVSHQNFAHVYTASLALFCAA